MAGVDCPNDMVFQSTSPAGIGTAEEVGKMLNIFCLEYAAREVQINDYFISVTN